MKKILILLLAFFSLLYLPSCDYLNAGWKIVTNEIPEFKFEVPDLFPGSYKVLSADGLTYTNYYSFSASKAFSYETVSSAGVVTARKGTYSLEYRLATINEFAGYITLTYSKASETAEAETLRMPFALTYNERTGEAELVLNGVSYTRTGAALEAEE